MIEQNWSAFDGTNLYAVIWKPVATPKAVMAFVHGHGTHCRRYDEWFGAFLAAGFAVISFDHRGHGRSGGKQGTIHRYSEYLEDNALLFRKARENFPHIPLVLYGHSMGATIVLSYLQLGKGLPEMAILASTWLELVQPPGKFKSLAIWLADSLIPQVTIKTGLKSKDFAPPASNVPPKPKDQLMHKRISARCFREVQRACKKIEPDSLPLSIPMLFMHGTNDRVSAPEASENLAKGMYGNATYREWADAPHQLHAWDQNDRVTDFTIEWINKLL
ncbi:MAG: lysophospholipase [Prolixibacteraceae bacterium]|jgi:alpha-beta hydrolase superfamily lysophospholipase|nr:lysophospholipase [Prolixibacteraceae bacterium]